MNIGRSSLFVAIAYTLPLCVWFLAQLLNAYQANESLSNVAIQCYTALIIIQVILLPIYLPWQTNVGAVYAQLAGIAVFLAVPLPILSLIWLIAGISTQQIINCLLIVFAFALLCYALLSLWAKLLHQEIFRTPIIVSTQVGLCVFAWHFHAQCLEYLGL